MILDISLFTQEYLSVFRKRPSLSKITVQLFCCLDIYTEIQAIVSGISSSSSKTNLPRAGKSIARTCGCRSGNQCRGMNDGVVWSSFMAMPAALLYFSKNWLWAGIFVFLSSCASVIYHVNREDKVFYA